VKIQLEQIDLLQPWPTLKLKPGYRAMNVLVRMGDAPVGEIMARPVRKRILTHRRLKRRIARKLSYEIIQHLTREAMSAGPAELTRNTNVSRGLRLAGKDWFFTKRFVHDEVLDPAGLREPFRTWVTQGQSRTTFACPPVTVVVCTRDRAQQLEGCIKNLLALDYPNYEILICDNSEDHIPTFDVCERLGVDYVREPIAGLSRARNRALKTARTRWVAFTDDDCRPEKNWLKELVRPLQDSRCRAVCGLVRAAQLENSAEITFEIYGGLGRGYYEQWYDKTWLDSSKTKTPPTWHIGAGANMLVDRHLVLKLGGYDIDMGPGGVGGCGEDTLVFFQILKQNFSIHYQPGALVHHYHRSSDRALRKHIHSYAVGHAAYLWHLIFRYAEYRAAIRLFAHLPHWFIKSWRHGVRAKTPYPHNLVWEELAGTLKGPVQYTIFKARRALNALLHQARGLQSAGKRPAPTMRYGVTEKPAQPPHDDNSQKLPRVA
jgi:glycosyltransferase involved in cell wall biosynthesis